MPGGIGRAYAAGSRPVRVPSPRAALELLKPITWFAPMWAFGCGVVSAGGPASHSLPVVAVGLLLAGPLVCGMSQAVNDWFDRHVDAINEPDRPIPSGRVPGRWGLGIALAWTAASLAVAAALGAFVFWAAALGVAIAWAYSAPPLRLKREGWLSATACAACYEGLPWVTGAAIVAGGAPDGRILALAGLYSLGAVGIMTLNDFKSVEGDRRMGIRSLPVRLGAARAARFACLAMAAPQLVVVALLAAWGRPVHAGIVGALVAVQVALMARLLADPRGRAPWYNATGTSLYVLGMLASAFAVAPLAAGAAP
ncbi:chlorophyll synthase ChlG [Elioraea sp.]|uniref:chlorophyll synthase ChlG n=1 Tax=Elioraea sp. TaxID=2185103 RepID=UPI0021DEE083|nr:chlorophyll synthase ChlG [Elioraea sp.]GIX09046.1 MAG: bacteriochlorophyll/chlorophyll a synthase [Elioraea sp.]